MYNIIWEVCLSLITIEPLQKTRGMLGIAPSLISRFPSLNIHINMVIFEPVSIMEVFFSQFLPYRSLHSSQSLFSFPEPSVTLLDQQF